MCVVDATISNVYGTTVNCALEEYIEWVPIARSEKEEIPRSVVDVLPTQAVPDSSLVSVQKKICAAVNVGCGNREMTSAVKFALTTIVYCI